MLTQTEFLQIESSANTAGLTISAFMRNTALGAEVRVKASRADDALIRQLAAIGNNLNQIAKASNAGMEGAQDDLNKTLENINTALMDLIQ